MTQQEFIEEVLKSAVEIELDHGLPAATITAQACLETGYGKYVLKQGNKYSYNIFNIKGVGTNGSVTVVAWEVINGKNVNVKSDFRAYNNFTESFEDYVKLIKGSSRYKPCVDVANNPDEYARQLQKCGYATDPNYPSKLISIMNNFNLKQRARELKNTMYKGLVNLALKEWQRQGGQVAVDYLTKNQLINNPEEWKQDEKLENPIQGWLFFILLHRLHEQLNK